MPSPSPMPWIYAARARVGHWQRTPLTFALLAVLGYCLAALPILAHHHFDPSAFIVAGDRYVDATQVPSPIIVQQNSNGYDGQFFYRLALSPFQLQQTAFGIQIDHPAYREQRIFYPVLVWIAAAGHQAAVPVAMFLVNLAGLAAIAVFATTLTARLRLPAITPLAIMLWPGFLIALTHDTSEIVATALLLLALDAYFAKRLLAYCVLGALATLTRQTTLPILAGVACFEAVQAIQTPRPATSWHRTLVCGLAMAPFLVWLAALHLTWGPASSAGTNLLGWPFRGAAIMLRDTLIGAKHFVQANRPGMDALVRVYVVESAAWLLAFCAVTATRIPFVLRLPNTGALAAGWLPIFALMSMMTADGGWVDRTGYFRAFTECYVVGCLIIAARPVPRWLTWLMLAGSGLAFLGAWVLTIGEK